MYMILSCALHFCALRQAGRLWLCALQAAAVVQAHWLVVPTLGEPPGAQQQLLRAFLLPLLPRAAPCSDAHPCTRPHPR